MSSSPFIDSLVATAEPVRPRRVSREILAVIAIALVQFAGTYVLVLGDGFQQALLWDPARAIFKMALLGAGTIGFTLMALYSFGPSARRIGPFTAVMSAVLFLLALMGFDWSLAGSLSAAFAPQHGSACVAGILALALPLILVLSLLMMRGASVQPGQSALLVGLAGGTWGAFIYSLQCPFVSLWYLAAWYGGGIFIVTLAARLILPRLARW
ncbi:NrsF family protein [Parvularcula sp. LCG005]|uniref:NrsF family protein n=1 Tax=Parvularcula sp. LCG005 TaxID=3078805 RepID=UPI0029422786|nr:NrsF family protein [Parvularcula sp. LCG005]WOI52762.1 NrsF family protein [Parvularcula sp. LCG005]